MPHESHHEGPSAAKARRQATVHGFESRKVTLHIVRHGEGHHNVAGEVNHRNYEKEEYFDAHLTEKGQGQARALQERMAALSSLQLAVVSTLSRAIQTGLLALEKRSDVPVVGIELSREYCEHYPCNRRRRKSHLVSTFPTVSFDEVEYESDPVYDHDRTYDQLLKRINLFVRWLHKRPETEVVMFSHGTFIHHLLSELDVRSEWFPNCHMVSVDIEYSPHPVAA